MKLPSLNRAVMVLMQIKAAWSTGVEDATLRLVRPREGECPCPCGSGPPGNRPGSHAVEPGRPDRIPESNRGHFILNTPETAAFFPCLVLAQAPEARDGGKFTRTDGPDTPFRIPIREVAIP